MAIAANETGALARWYIDTLGFRAVVDGGPTGTWFIVPPEGGALIEIIAASDAPAQERARNDPGWSHLAFTVSDFDATVEDLKAKGVVFTDVSAMQASGSRLAFFLDRDGNVLQIVSRLKPLG